MESSPSFHTVEFFYPLCLFLSVRFCHPFPQFGFSTFHPIYWIIPPTPLHGGYTSFPLSWIISAIPSVGLHHFPPQWSYSTLPFPVYTTFLCTTGGVIPPFRSVGLLLTPVGLFHPSSQLGFFYHQWGYSHSWAPCPLSPLSPVIR